MAVRPTLFLVHCFFHMELVLWQFFGSLFSCSGQHNKCTPTGTAFLSATAFNADLSKWRVDKVTDMTSSKYLSSTCTHEFFFMVICPICFHFLCSQYLLSSLSLASVHGTHYDTAFFKSEAFDPSVFNADLSKWQVNQVTTMRHSKYCNAHYTRCIYWNMLTPLILLPPPHSLSIC